MKLTFLKNRMILIVSILLASFLCVLNTHATTYDPFDFGAKGDARTLDTEAIQAAIDKCHQDGGGRVYLHQGCFISGTIYLKSNVNLHIEAGAILRGSASLDDYPIIPSRYPSYSGDYVTNKMLIYAEDARNITISGRGTIDGRGDDWIEGPYGFPSFSLRPRIIHFRGCEDIHVRDITLYNSASWVQSYQSCRNLNIDGITVDSRENKDIEKSRFADAPGRNNDGLDLVDCEIVRISNCYINSGDDAICLKSFSPDEACRDITITNCVVSANASGIKIGTETSGKFEDITVQNCVVYDTRGHAISLMTLDGARMERIHVSGIVARNIKGSVIHIHLANRNRTYRKEAEINQPHLRDIIIENVQGTIAPFGYGCFISGVPDQPIENVIIRNINLKYVEQGILHNSYKLTPYRQNDQVFGTLTGYGVFIWHAKNIVVDDVKLHYSRDEKLLAMLCDNVELLEIRGLNAPVASGISELIRIFNCKDVVVTGCMPTSQVPVFVSADGEKPEDVTLFNNMLRNAKQEYVFNKNQK